MKARRAGDRFAVARIAKALSPQLAPDILRQTQDTKRQLKTVTAAIDELDALWAGDANPSLSRVLSCIARNRLLEIPESLLPAAKSSLETESVPLEEDERDAQNERAMAIEKFLAAPFSQLEPFGTYLVGEAHFDTHQGVKGLEFDRVMVIMDDVEARGFTFKYENLFGGRASGDPGVEATRRLFYVTCSRARKSLALVAYATSPDRVRRFVLEQRWFEPDEIVGPAQLAQS